MSISVLSRLDCAPLKKAMFMRRLHFVARNFDALYAASLGDTPPPLSAQDIYITLDPDLAALNKQVQDAKARYDQVRQLYDTGDPMIEMALWQVESCQSAFDTRLIELEQDETLPAQAELETEEVSPMPMARLEREAQPENGLLVIFALMILFGIFPFNRRPVFAPRPA